MFCADSALSLPQSGSSRIFLSRKFLKEVPWGLPQRDGSLSLIARLIHRHSKICMEAFHLRPVSVRLPRTRYVVRQLHSWLIIIHFLGIQGLTKYSESSNNFHHSKPITNLPTARMLIAYKTNKMDSL